MNKSELNNGINCYNNENTIRCCRLVNSNISSPGTSESHCGSGWRLLLTHFLFLPVQLVGCTPHLSCGKVLEQTTSHFCSLLFISCCIHAQQQSPTDSAESLRRAAVACSIHSCPLGVLMSPNHCSAIL